MINKKQNLPNAYIVQDLQGNREINRLVVQDHMFTTGMSGVLAEQENPAQFKRVLDIGCGTGGWIVETAKMFPEISELFGVDVNRELIEYARKLAAYENIADRVKFEVTDATLLLRFPQNYFDLVNMRVASSFLRTWEWPDMIIKILNKLSLGGILRVTDALTDPQSNSPALNEFFQLFTSAYYQSGHLFDNSSSSLIDQLPNILHQQGCVNVQTKQHNIDLSAGTPGGQAYIQDVEHLVHTIKPFLQKWTGAKDLDILGQQVLAEMNLPTFQGTFTLITTWGTKSLPERKGMVSA